MSCTYCESMRIDQEPYRRELCSVWCCAVQSDEIVPALSGSFPPAHSATPSSPSCTRRCTVSFPPAQQRSTCFLPPASWSPAGLVKKTSLVLFRSSSLHPLLSSLHPNTTPQRCLTPPLASSALCLSLPVPTFQPLSHPPFSPEDLHVVDPHPSYRHASSLPRHLRPFDFCDSGNLSAATTIDRPCLSSAGLGGDLAGCNDAAAAPTQR